jgi:hypothetical protein
MWPVHDGNLQGLSRGVANIRGICGSTRIRGICGVANIRGTRGIFPRLAAERRIAIPAGTRV